MLGIACSCDVSTTNRRVTTTDALGLVATVPHDAASNVVAVTVAKVRRVEPANMPGWFGIAASFDDLKFDRDDEVPTYFPSV